MPYPFFVRLHGNALVPTSKAGQIAIEKLKPGTLYKIDPRQPRNGKQHRLFWAFVTYVAEALNDGPAGAHWTAEDVKDDLLVATGRCRTRPMSRIERQRNAVNEGTHAVVARPVSISFSKMDGSAFSTFMNDAFGYVRDDLAPWIEGSPHWQDIQVILAESWALSGEDAT